MTGHDRLDKVIDEAVDLVKSAEEELKRKEHRIAQLGYEVRVLFWVTLGMGLACYALVGVILWIVMKVL